MKITIDRTKQDSKPTSKQTAYIHNNLIEQDLDIGDIASGLAYSGWTIAPATYNGSRSNDNFKSQQLYMLDFDGGLTFSGAYNICSENNILPTFAYETFSSTTEDQRFRMAFIYPVEVSGSTERDIIQNQLMVLFKDKLDKAAKESARLFYGSNKGLLYTNWENTIDPINLEAVAASKLKESTGKNYNRYKNRVENEENSTSAIIYNYSKCANLLTFEELDIVKDNTLTLVCPAYSGIMSGNDYHHDIKFRLGTVLNYLPRLKPAYIRAVQETSNQDYTYQLKVARKYGPLSCSLMCPHYNTCTNHSIYSALKYSSNYIRLSDTTEYKPLDEVRLMLEKEVEQITHDKKIHVIKAQCGIGKTFALRNMRDVSIAFPLHNLKQEVADKWFSGVRNLLVTKDLPDLPEDIKKEVKLLYGIGASSKADSLVIAHGGTEGTIYVNQRNSVLSGTVLTTHAKIFYNSTANDMVYFDEDPLSEMIKCVTIKAIDVMAFVNYLKKRHDMNCASYYAQFVQGSMNHGLITKVTPSIIDGSELYDTLERYNEKNQTNSTNLYDLINATYFVEHSSDTEHYITYAYKRELPKDKTIVILSATISKEFAELVYGDRLVWHELPKVKYNGKVVQDFRYSFSKVRMNQYTEDILKVLVNSERPTITYKTLKSKVNTKKNKIPHIGASIGSDELKGKDINVAATPRMNPIQIRLYASVMGAPNVFEHVDSEKVHLIVNGYEMNYKTYSNKYLRAIDLNYTASQLEQAVGRSRVLTEGCTVYVYSHFPVEQAIVEA